MSRDCPYCRSHPRGIEGHQALFIVDIRPMPNFMTGTPVFRCSVCGSLWVREYGGGGGFAWSPIRPGGEEPREIRLA